jgi:hypothetical protein
MNGQGRRPNFETWPELPYGAWKETLDTLHMNLQIVQPKARQARDISSVEVVETTAG